MQKCEWLFIDSLYGGLVEHSGKTSDIHKGLNFGRLRATQRSNVCARAHVVMT